MAGLLNRRYAALYPTVFVTFRKETDDLPSKEWPISREVSVSPVASSKFHLRSKTSTFYAVVAGAYKTLQMFAFSVTWPHGSDITGPERLVLALDTKEEAGAWLAGRALRLHRVLVGGQGLWRRQRCYGSC